MPSLSFLMDSLLVYHNYIKETSRCLFFSMPINYRKRLTNRSVMIPNGFIHERKYSVIISSQMGTHRLCTFPHRSVDPFSHRSGLYRQKIRLHTQRPNSLDWKTGDIDFICQLLLFSGTIKLYWTRKSGHTRTLDRFSTSIMAFT